MQASAQKYGGGLQAGVIYSWLNTDSKKGSAESGRLNFTYGAFLDVNLTDNFTFTTGLNINHLGGSISYKDSIKLNWDDKTYEVKNTPEVTYNVQYLELPISFKGKTQEIGYITYFGRLGASPMIALKSRANIEGEVMDGAVVLTEDEKSDLNVKENINLFNIGWHVGGGIEYSLGGSTSIIVELMFSQNFLSMTKDNVTKDTSKDVNVTNGLMVLKAGIKF